MTAFLSGPNGQLAYDATPGTGPLVVFLGGLQSDMQGTKALWLQDQARAQGRAFLRLDYSGHGDSAGAFEDGCISDWLADAEAVITAVAQTPVVLVGSSMGGWIAALIARAGRIPVAGLVGIAAAPDFTENGFWAELDAPARARLMEVGHYARPSDYGDPYIITRRLIEDGRNNLILNAPLSLPMPVRLLQGTADADVPMDWALRLLDHADSPDLRLTLVKGADHRFSSPECLTLIGQAVDEVLATCMG